MRVQSFSLVVMLAAALPVAAQDAASALFTGREVRGNGTRPKGTLPKIVTDLVSSPLGQTYKNLKAERSLILSDCAPKTFWCKQTEFQFASVVGTAAKVARSQKDALLASWLLSVPSTIRIFLHNWHGSGKPPFTLLAIVNRMDLAQWHDDHWETPELRFVYGAQNEDRQMTLIIEFVLPPFDWHQFQTFGRAWAALSSPNGQSLDHLENVLLRSRYDQSVKVRIRTNTQLAPSWEFDEWDLFPGTPILPSQPLAASLLEDQIDAKYSTVTPGTADYYDYLQAWPDVSKMPGPKNIPIPANLWMRATTYGAGEDPLATPPSYCTNTLTRNTVALQRCTGCHMVETANQKFTHISMRAQNGNSTLSPFLQGTNPNIELEDLYYQSRDRAELPQNKVLSVPLTFDTFERSSSGFCDKPVPQQTVRLFHDLARRKLFLATLLTATTHMSDFEATKILHFATDYSH